MIKKFVDWFRIKPVLDAKLKYPKFEEGEVWWCHLGENVGHEENGKGDQFLRPVIVVKKFNRRLFYGLPTTTIAKDNDYYFRLAIKSKSVYVMLSQMRAVDASRLLYRQARIKYSNLKALKKAFVNKFLSKK